MTTVEEVSRRARAYVGGALFCGATSVLLTWAAMTRAPGLRVPPTVALFVAGVAGVAAWRLTLLARGAADSGDGAATLLFAGTTAICWWIAFGPGARRCVVGLGYRALEGAAGVACRGPFGIGALLAAAAALYALHRWRHRSSSAADRALRPFGGDLRD